MVEQRVKMGEHRLFSNEFLRLCPIISSIMVIGIHSYNAGSIDGVTITTLVEGFFSHGLFCAAVPVFFIMSSYLFFSNVSSMHDIVLKWKRRVKTIIIPFLAWSALYYAFFSICNHVLHMPMLHAPSLQPLHILKGIVLYEYCFPLWYMFQLIIFFLLSPVILYAIKALKQYSWMLVAACYVAALLGYGDVGTLGGAHAFR